MPIVRRQEGDGTRPEFVGPGSGHTNFNPFRLFLGPAPGCLAANQFAKGCLRPQVCTMLKDQPPIHVRSCFLGTRRNVLEDPQDPSPRTHSPKEGEIKNIS